MTTPAKKIKNTLKQLPVKVGMAGLAILLVAADRSGKLIAEFFGVNKEESLGKSLRRINGMKDFDDYYDLVKNFVKNEKSAKALIWQLKQKGLVTKNSSAPEITKLGEKIVNAFVQKVKKRQDWDNKYRLVFFDIPEKRRSQREWIYYNLINQDYRPVQKSVLIGKFPLEEEFMKEIIERKLYQHVRVITIGEVDDERLFL